MRLRIIIDTQDGDQAPEQPFTLSLWKDDEDGTPSRMNATIDGDAALVGERVDLVLVDLARAFTNGEVLDQSDTRIPNTAAQWRAAEQEDPTHD